MHMKRCSTSLIIAVKSLQSCPTLCDPIDSRPPGFPVPGILQAWTLEWVAIRKMQIKATVRYPLTPVRMVIIKMSRNKYWRGCGEKGALLHCWWNVDCYSHYAEQYRSSFKSQNKTTYFSFIFKLIFSNPTSGHIFGKNLCSKGYMHTSQCSLQHCL